MCRIIRQVPSKTHVFILATIPKKILDILLSKSIIFQHNCLLIEIMQTIIHYKISIKILMFPRALLRTTLNKAKEARSREPPSAVTYDNLQQRISLSVLILGA